MTGDDGRGMAETVAGRSYGKLMAILAGRTGDVAAAEDALSEAFAAALADWPANGCPSNPEGWLLAVARRKAIDAVRRRQTGERHATELQILAETPETPGDIPDQRLSLLFVCAHPALDTAIRAPLMLQVVLGLDARAIASAFLTSPAAMGKRLVRAKEKIRVAGIPFRVPERAELPGRVDAVLDAVYAAFTEGWHDPEGTDSARRELTSEAIYLARVVAELMPEQPEALGLLSLMLHAEARRRARRNARGEYVPLAEQDQTQWNWDQIREAEALLLQAGSFRRVGRYQVEAALQSAHVHRCRTGEPNWAAVVQLYDLLLAVTGSPVVAINRAVAIAEVEGPANALAIVDSLAQDGRLAGYQSYWAARAHLLARTGAVGEASQAYDMAIGLERDEAVRQFLLRRRAQVRG